jgi:hypothetical protein
LSIQTINGIEGCRIWVSDKTLIRLAEALNIEVFQLLAPSETGTSGYSRNTENLHTLWKIVRSDIDAHFDRLGT